MMKFQTMPQLGNQPEYVVDVTVSVNGTTQQFQKLPANQEFADFGVGNLFVSMSRDAMNAEIANLKKMSEDHLRRVDEEQSKIAVYEGILQQLNPEYAEKQRQEQEIVNLRSQVTQIAQGYSNIENMMNQLLAKLDGETKNSKNK
ncbi:MAG: hypothetical protein NC418_02355 [Muribaculaceae bacterium]|nr:hypothetical protein [Muribaculaceae bacterium]